MNIMLKWFGQNNLKGLCIAYRVILEKRENCEKTKQRAVKAEW